MPAAARAAQAVTGAAIAADALRWTGKGYVFGGPASSPGDWDCSSFVSYVLGHDLGLPLPGGQWGQPGYPPNAHGPVVTDYAAWTSTAAVAPSAAAPGDLVCWVGAGAAGHVGIVLGPDKMISALNPSMGTLVSPIAGYGPLGVPQVYRRLTAVAPGTVTAGPPAAQHGGTVFALLLGAAVVGFGVAAIVGLAALAAAGVTLGAGYLARKAAG